MMLPVNKTAMNTVYRYFMQAFLIHLNYMLCFHKIIKLQFHLCLYPPQDCHILFITALLYYGSQHLSISLLTYP